MLQQILRNNRPPFYNTLFLIDFPLINYSVVWQLSPVRKETRDASTQTDVAETSSYIIFDFFSK